MDFRFNLSRFTWAMLVFLASLVFAFPFVFVVVGYYGKFLMW